MTSVDATIVNRPPGIGDIIDTAQAAGVTPSQLAIEAGYATQQIYRWINGGRRPLPDTRRRLRMALQRLTSSTSARDRMVWSVYRAHLAMQAAFLGLDVERTVWADPAQPNSAAWRDTAPARHRAIYLTVVALGVSMKEMARVTGVSKQAISKLLREIEDQRDDAGLDAELDRWEQIMVGGQA